MSIVALVRYAGYEPEPEKSKPLTAEQTAARRRRQRRRLAKQAYLLFKSGKDTREISAALSRRESTILKWISIMRSEIKGLPTPYPAQPSLKAAGQTTEVSSSPASVVTNSSNANV